MKKSALFSAVAALALASPLAVGAASAQQNILVQEAQLQGERGQRDDDRANRDQRGDDNARDHRNRRETWRDGRGDARWDDSQHNGYYMNGRWTYGQPSAAAYGRPGFSLGYRPWAIGQSLGYYNGRYAEVDYRRQQLRRPARGQHWVRDDRGDYLLVNRAGRVLQVVIGGYAPRDRRQNWRDDRANARWDDNRHNGYYRNSQWSYGPPPAGVRDVVYGYQPWRRGQRLGYYNGRYAEVDYRSERSLRQPGRGQHWVRNDGGDFLLVAIATGVIVQAIISSNR
jgi:Ni/Co efflux regulator RcnB